MVGFWRNGFSGMFDFANVSLPSGLPGGQPFWKLKQVPSPVRGVAKRCLSCFGSAGTPQRVVSR